LLVRRYLAYAWCHLELSAQFTASLQHPCGCGVASSFS